MHRPHLLSQILSAIFISFGDFRISNETERSVSVHFIITFVLLLLALISESASTQLTQCQTTKLYSHGNEVAILSDDNDTTKDISFLPVVYVSLINTVINILRPDPSIIWQVSDKSLLCT